MRDVVNVVSFANSELKHPIRRFSKQLNALDPISKLTMYNEHTVPAAYLEKFRSVFDRNHRGFGYYSWKPAIILDCLENLPDGALVMYSDIGNHVNIHGRAMYNRLFAVLDTLDIPIIANQIATSMFNERRYTKGDVIDYFNVRNEDFIIDSGQFQSGMIFFRKCDETMEFMHRWYQVLHSGIRLFDDSPSVSPCFPEFIEHRHDQSAFSILCKLSGVYGIPHYLFYVGDPKTRDDIRFSPILNLRDLYGSIPFDTLSRLRLIKHRIKSVISARYE
jgi:hypothetical protein